MSRQLSAEELSSVRAAALLITESLDRMTYSHRHKNVMGGCDECENISKLSTALNKLLSLDEKPEA